MCKQRVYALAAAAAGHSSPAAPRMLAEAAAVAAPWMKDKNAMRGYETKQV